ncbi:hypothetical protein KFL_001940200 [Klebsormidium nitens]|uniref:Uncharacterized protein n=1 Tax=Klebsormidium nitens TaxID=105231 RepID=A0A1Y1I260_KLENI|nr:hypothetical protein KFL_001940200 [Klebsormidium nitens]|eukprot:GAQ84563.1 hypothetical protein KFL_001940200 [Klebsormidium nitens]
MKSLMLWGAFEQPLHDCLLEELRAGSEFDLQVVFPSSTFTEPQQTLQSLPNTAAVNLDTAEARFNDEELRALRGADIILHQLRQTESEREEFADVLRVLKAGPQGKETVFIAVSDILTWARLRVDMEEPCSTADEPRRRPHPQYGDLLEAERRVTRAQKQGLLRTYVVWPGVQYGGGERALESVFRDSWSGEGPTVYGFGDNVLPTIHVSDLATFIKHVAVTLPPQQHLLAVDEARCTQQALVEGVAAHFGADVRRMSVEEMWLSNRRVEPSLLLNLPMQATPLEEMTWRFKDGPLPYVARLARDFLDRRGLAPLRVSLHGPPAAGKSALARALAQEYGVDVLSVPAVIKWALEECEDPVLRQSASAALAPPPPVPEPKPKKGQPVAPSPEPKRPRLSDALLVQAVRGYLTSGKLGPECRRNGFILDGFPKTLAQTQLLFADEPVRSEASRTPEPPEPEASRPSAKRVSSIKPTDDKTEAAPKAAGRRASPLIRMMSSKEVQPPLPPEAAPEAETGTSGAPKKEQWKVKLDWSVLLKATDEILAARIAAIPEKERAGTHNVGTEFARRISVYNEAVLPELEGILESVRTAGASILEIDQAEIPERPMTAQTERSVASDRNTHSAGSDRPNRSAGSDRNTVSAGSDKIGSVGSERNIGSAGSDRNTRSAGSAGSLGDGLSGTMPVDEALERESVAGSETLKSPKAGTPGMTSAGSRLGTPKSPSAHSGGLPSPGTRPPSGASSSGIERTGGNVEKARTPVPKVEPTGMGLEMVIGRVRAALGPPERYAGSKRKPQPVERTEPEPAPQEQGSQEHGQDVETSDEPIASPEGTEEAAAVQSSDSATVLPEPEPGLAPKPRATLEQRSAGIQAWLASTVMPAVLQAMLHAARARADDPAEAMARHLLHTARLQKAQERAAQT